MEKLLLKRTITDVCKRIKQETLQSLRSEIADYQESANQYGQAKDRYDSFREQVANKRDMLVQQYQKVQEEINLLDRINLERECEYGGFGSVVVTPLQKVFISIGIGKITLDDGSVYYAISAVVPFAKAVKEHKKGDHFEFNGKKMEIIDLF